MIPCLLKFLGSFSLIFSIYNFSSFISSVETFYSANTFTYSIALTYGTYLISSPLWKGTSIPEFEVYNKYIKVLKNWAASKWL